MHFLLKSFFNSFNLFRPTVRQRCGGTGVGKDVQQQFFTQVEAERTLEMRFAFSVGSYCCVTIQTRLKQRLPFATHNRPEGELCELVVVFQSDCNFYTCEIIFMLHMYVMFTLKQCANKRSVWHVQWVLLPSHTKRVVAVL